MAELPLTLAGNHNKIRFNSVQLPLASYINCFNI